MGITPIDCPELLASVSMNTKIQVPFSRNILSKCVLYINNVSYNIPYKECAVCLTKKQNWITYIIFDNNHCTYIFYVIIIIMIKVTVCDTNKMSFFTP